MTNAAHLLDEKMFRSAVRRERRRADRSDRPLALLLVTIGTNDAQLAVRRAVADALGAVKDDTHVAGWFDRGQTLGLLAPDLATPVRAAASDLESTLRQELANRIDGPVLDRITIDVRVHQRSKSEAAVDMPPLDTVLPADSPATLYDAIKRTIDVAGSLTLLALLAPVFLVIAALVKLKSPGPVFFRQERIGQGMQPFTMLKFRTMHANAGAAPHHEFVTAFIKAGSGARVTSENGMFKIKNDGRVTTVGRILRKTSLDELPQLWNVVRGDMSLVGPRPPLRYEVDEYQAWHCRRVLEAKPGITGLWQVEGRSRTTFDEMVRLDLRYAKGRSFWTDVKILLATPAAVIVGRGAA